MESLPLLLVFGLGIAAAILTISQRNPIHSALFLILTLFSVAASFLFLRADFLAMVQVILYAGAIMVLILFVLLLTAQEEIRRERLFHTQSPLALLIGLGLVAALGFLFFQSPPLPRFTAGSPGFEGAGSSLQDLGMLLFTTYVFPFELASILLLVALVATIAIAKKETPP